ncbi:uncharacterized protein LOC111299864 isoform X3 [Durio zibethinus]|uniref:Uncharacterized protein LOC111299864 isoform X3 n=1 Tax=Durio zibethinus TaxID=66656 RepID=A0A6P5ZFF7_DURZI|nr:uncharacterized protein LOC111299864 isoform X3 [Durio zibethinus]
MGKYLYVSNLNNAIGPKNILKNVSSKRCRCYIFKNYENLKMTKCRAEKEDRMEELRKLEQLHRTLTFMQSHNFVSSSTLDSNRFLANLILLLLQPCGELNLDAKCSLISEYIPKISVTFLEEASQWVSLETDERDSQEINNPPDKTDCLSLQINQEEVAMVGLEAMERASSTLEDFCRSYFMFHGMDISSPQMIFKYFPVLAFTESYIYQLDGLNEKILCVPTEGGTALAKEFEKISIEDVMRAIHLKSFDYRVLNLLLYQLRGEEVNDLHMEFLSVSEFLVEISDDLFDYEDDVLENNFNILRMFVKIYGPSTAPTMLAKYITDAEERYDNLLKSLDPHLSSKYQRRCEEATKEGGKVSEHPLGTWSIPPLIVNEDLYRSNCLNTE